MLKNHMKTYGFWASWPETLWIHMAFDRQYYFRLRYKGARQAYKKAWKVPAAPLKLSKKNGTAAWDQLRHTHQETKSDRTL